MRDWLNDLWIEFRAFVMFMGGPGSLAIYLSLAALAGLLLAFGLA